MSYKSQTVSAVVITDNSAATLEQCLSSLHWTDELIVLDCGSTDQTLAIARRFTDKIFFHPGHNLSTARRDALSLGKSDWLLLVEADEWVEDMLKHEIDGVLLNVNPDIHGYTIARKLKFQNHWVEHGLPPDPRTLRLVRKNQWRVSNDWDAALAVNGSTMPLDRTLGYAPYATIEDLFTDINRRSTLSAYDHLARHGTSAYGYSLLNLILQFKRAGWQGFILRGGLWNGFTGVVMAMAHAVETFLKFAKIRILTAKP